MGWNMILAFPKEQHFLQNSDPTTEQLLDDEVDSSVDIALQNPSPHPRDDQE